MESGPEKPQSANVSQQLCNIKKVLFMYVTHTHTNIGIDCGLLPDIANGKVAIAPDTRLGSTATYSCNAGFNLVGAATRQCQANGEWSGQEPSCERKYFGLKQN